MTGTTRETISVVKSKRKSSVSGRITAGRPAAGLKDISQILAANLSDIIIRIQPGRTDKLIYISPACLQVFGYSSQEFHADINLTSRAIHPEDASVFSEFLRPDIDYDRPVTLRWIRKDGRIVWTEQTKTIIRNEKGEPQEICFIARDISERKLAEEKLQESQKFISSLLENAPHPTVVINPDTSIRYVNPAWEEINGWTLDEVIGLKAPYPWWPDDDPEIIMKHFMMQMEKGGSAEIISRKKNGDEYWASMNWSPVKQHGELQYLLINAVDITERKLAEEFLKESEDKFAKAFQTSPEMMAIISLNDFKYIEVNESYISLSKRSREKLIGRKISDPGLLVFPEERARMDDFLKQQKKFKHEEFHFRLDSGEIRIWLYSGDIIKIGGEPHLLLVATDITEHKQAIEALRESEDKFARAFQASPDAICISTLDEGRFVEVNDSLVKSLGYSREEIIGRTSLELNIWPDARERALILSLIKKDHRVRGEQIKFRTKSGDFRTCLFSAEPITIGNKSCMISVISDITERKQVEERLRLVSSVTQQVSDATIVLSRELNITYMNQAAEKMFGYSAEEVFGKSIALFSARPVPKENIQRIFDIVKSGQVWRGTAQKKKKDGTIITSKIELGPLYDENGRISSYIDVEHDITEQVAMEARLKEQNNLIESILATMPEGVLVIDSNDRIILANQAFYKIFHITKKAIVNKPLDTIIPKDKLSSLYVGILLGQTTNNTLEFRYTVKGIEKIISCCAAKMDGDRLLLTFTDISQERDEEEKLYLTDRLASLGEMAAGLAHELNNPLTGILALSQLLVNNHPPEEQKEDLQCIFSEAKRAAEIVKNVLLFARNNNFISGQASAGEVVTEVLRLRQYEHKSANIAVVTHFQEDLPRMAIDRYQLQQVCLNIILNAESAIKETGKPGAITIKTEKTGDSIAITFSDTGCGIKKHILPRIFDPFFTTKDIGKGTGLGLSICYGIVVKHGGKISVRSRVNEGAVFTVRLPVATVNTTAGKE